MRPVLGVVVACVLVTASSITHARKVPAFEDCAARAQSTSRQPTLNFADARARMYRSVLRDAAKGRANFAGRYVIAEWGCGAACVMAVVIDKSSGRVTSLPFTVSDWPLNVTEPLEYRANSCLLVVRGSRNESNEHGTYYYTFDGAKFHLLATAPTHSR